MSKQHNHNREKLAQLIFRTRSFTEAELVKRFEQNQNGKTEIGPLKTIREYLENLRKLGLLGIEGERYILLRNAKAGA
jgi:hypothetical protein